MIHKLLQSTLGIIIAFIYSILRLTWRLHQVNLPIRRSHEVSHLFAHWHGDELLLIGTHTGMGMAVMASNSKDGRLMAVFLKTLGYFTVRGSSTRGAVGALKGLVDAVTIENRDASIAVDGPRGPIFKVKPGILKLAQVTGRPIIPAVSACKSAFVFQKAWNKCYIPYPFAKCEVIYGPPFSVPEKLSKEEFENLRQKLETQMLGLKKKVEAQVFGLLPQNVGV